MEQKEVFWASIRARNQASLEALLKTLTTGITEIQRALGFVDEDDDLKEDC